MKNAIISLVIYPYDIMVSIDQSDSEFRRSIVNHAPPTILKDLEEDGNAGILTLSANCNGRTVHLDGGQTMIRMNGKVKTPEQFGTLAHEIFHAVDFIFTRLNMKLSRDSDEAFAYAIGYVTEQIYKKFKLIKK